MRVHHLALRTNNLPALERFYTDVVGLSVLRRADDGQSVWLDAEGTLVMLERRDDAEPPIARDSMELTCFAIASDEHREVFDRLVAADVPIESRTSFTLYFRDPDGRRVALSSYPDPLTLDS